MHDEETGRREVREVMMTLTEPSTANRISEMANVNKDMTVKYLDEMVEANEVLTHEVDNRTLYYPDPVTQLFEDIINMEKNNTREELSQEINDIWKDIDRFKKKYDVEDPDDLESMIGEVSEEKAQEIIRDVEDWRYFKKQKELITITLLMKTPIEKARKEAQSFFNS